MIYPKLRKAEQNYRTINGVSQRKLNRITKAGNLKNQNDKNVSINKTGQVRKNPP